MNKLISLELKRNSLRPYHVAVLISAVSLLALLYLLAAIPKLDPTEADIDIFMSYNSLVGLTNIILMVVFTILSAVMSAKFIVEEYAGKKVLLLFSYPIERRKILGSKISMVFLYTVISMILCGTVVFFVFFLTESFFPLCADVLGIKTIVYSFLSLVCYSLLAGVWGIIALWFGFGKQSITVTIVAAVIIATIPTILLSPLGDILADRANRRNIMVALDTLTGISVLCAAILLSQNNDIAVIGVLLILLSVLGAFESPTVQACVPQMQKGDNIIKGNAIVNQVAAVAALIAPILGSVLYVTFGLKPVMYASILCFFITALFECFIKLEYKRSDMHEGILAIVKNDFSISMRFICKE